MPVDMRPEKVESQPASSPTELIREYFMTVYNVCFRVLGRPQDAEDATQETFLSLFRSQDKLAAAGSARAWILTVARNTSISMLRTRRPEVPLVDRAVAGGPIRDPADPERLRLALAGLSEEDRRLVQMRFLEGKSPGEMVAATGRTPRAVATALCRALERLRGLYHGDLGDRGGSR
jgi:RNA polymerase sigma factor (sigma-70 family)